MNYTQDDNLENIIFRNNDIIVIDYIDNYKKIILSPGMYKIECYGAAGGYGDGNQSYRGLGGYSKGIINLQSLTTIFAYPGEYGGDGINRLAGFNGGSQSSSAGGGHDGGRGGGASDIRLVNGNWDDITSLRSRLIIAAGGGGAQPTCGGYSSQGHGGGLNGVGSYNPAGSYIGAQTTGGTQTTGGSGNRNPISNGSFGKGATCSTCGAGSGGGYYGGGSCYTAGGGGGSSFISGMIGCNAIDINGNHTGQPNHYSGLVFEDCETQSGIQDGHGKIIITCLQVRYYYLLAKDYNINTVTLNDFLQHGKAQEEILGEKVESFLFASLSNEIPIKILQKNQIIINSGIINMSHIQHIWEIKINGQLPLNSNLLFLINNRDDWYTYKYDEWNNIGSTISSLITEIQLLNFGMTIDEVNNIPPEKWIEIYPDYEKYFSFTALLISDEFDISPIISDIAIMYDSNTIGKRKVHDTLYTIKNKIDLHEITWNTINKRKIEVIFINKNTI